MVTMYLSKFLKWILFVFAFICIATVFYVYTDKQKLQEDFVESEWMLAQIRKDLEPFEQGFSTSDIDDVFKNRGNTKFIKVSINEKGISFLPAEKYSRALRVEHYLERLFAKYDLPKTEFLICLEDEYSPKEGSSCPVFAFAKNAKTQLSSILMPDFDALKKGVKLIGKCKSMSNAHPWAAKQPKIFWRGATSGGNYTLDNYVEFPRVKLVEMGVSASGWLDARFTQIAQISEPIFAQIASKIGTTLAPSEPLDSHFQYKYLIDIDGNSCTYERCRWILLSNSVLIKPDSDKIQWYYSQLIPYVNYVPVDRNLVDLEAKYTWLQENDEQARKIADQGTLTGQRIFNQKAIDHYMLLLLREYKKKADIKKNSVNLDITVPDEKVICCPHH